MSEGPEQRWRPWFGPAGARDRPDRGVVGGASSCSSRGRRRRAHGNLSPGETDVATVIQDLAFVGVAVVLAARSGRWRPRQFGLVAAALVVARRSGVVLVALVAFFVLSDAWLRRPPRSGEEKELVKEIGGNAGTLVGARRVRARQRGRADLRGDPVPRVHVPLARQLARARGRRR